MPSTNQAAISGGPWHLSPIALAVASGAGGILLSFFPPSAYEQIIGEPDRMFGNIGLAALIGACVAFFALGAKLAQGRNWQIAVSPPQIQHEAPQGWILLFCVLVVAVVGFVAISFASELLGVLRSLASGNADEFRSEMLQRLTDTGFSPMTLLPLGLPLVYWSLAKQIQAPIKRSSLLVGRVVQATLILYVAGLVVTLQRSLLIPFLLGLLCLFSGLKWHPNGASVRKLMSLALGLIAVFIAIFLMFSYFRSGDSDSPWMLLVGYIPASYNRLAAAVDGALKSDVAGIYYTFRFLWHPPVIRRLIPIGEFAASAGVRIPETILDGWFSEFENIASAGLNPMFIWPTAFGYTFYDIGWLSPIYFLFLGVVSGYAWKSFIARRDFGLVVYPYVASSILLWSTDNFMSLPQADVVFITAAILALIGTRLMRRMKSPAEGAAMLSTS